MDVSHLVRLRLGGEPPLEDAERPDPREVDRICTQLRWPDAYAVTWICYAAHIPVHDPDGKPFEWTRRQLRGFLLMRHLYQQGRLQS